MIFKQNYLLLFISALVIYLSSVSGQKCECSKNRDCRPGHNATCASGESCSGFCVGIGEWAFCRPNPNKCHVNSSVSPVPQKHENHNQNQLHNQRPELNQRQYQPQNQNQPTYERSQQPPQNREENLKFVYEEGQMNPELQILRAEGIYLTDIPSGAEVVVTKKSNGTYTYHWKKFINYHL